LTHRVVTESERMRRPPRRRRPDDNRRPLDPAERREREEQRFVEDLENRIRFFLLSEDNELALEPMNSYKRRLVHKIAVQYKLGTESRGEEPNRSVCLLRTEEAVIPEERVQRVRLWDFGAQVFPVKPGTDGVRLALKQDGSIEIWNEGDKHRYVTDRLVTSRQIRIRQGKIVTPDDPEW
jgi:hypothetical protein